MRKRRIIKYDRFRDYKVRQRWITNCDRFWITKCDKNLKKWISKFDETTKRDGLQTNTVHVSTLIANLTLIAMLTISVIKQIKN